MLNVTNIPAARVPFVDPDTGLMTREWYRFLYNSFLLSGGGSNQTTLNDLQVAPPAVDASADITLSMQNLEVGPAYTDSSGSIYAAYDQAVLTAYQPSTQGTIASYNVDNTPVAGGVVYGTNSAFKFSAAGTAGYVLSSNGAAAPTWVSLGSLGAGAVTSDYTSSRALSTTYTNTTGGPITVYICVSDTVIYALMIATIDSASLYGNALAITGQYMELTMVIPPGSTYSCYTNGTPTLRRWVETR